jgi:hypothetical protein
MQQNGKAPAGRAARWLAWTALTAAYSILTSIYLRPIWRVGGDRLAPSLEDPLFNLYVLKWSVHQLRLGLPDLWNANLFYPTRGAFVLSDHLLGPAAQLALFLKIVPNAIAGYNFLLFTSFVGSALAVCWVFRRAGLSWTAAALAGWMFAFSPFRVSQMSHLQILIAQWIPLTLWFWDRLLAERTVKSAALFLLFYGLHVTGGCYLAYMIHFPMLALLAVRMAAQGREILSGRSLRLLVPVGLLAGAAALAVFLPYATFSKSLGAARTDAEIQKFGATPASYVSPVGEDARTASGTEKALFAGFLPTALFLVGAIVSWRRGEDRWRQGLALTGLLCFALTFPLVYAPLMRVVPGLGGMRVPARFYAFVSLALVYFAALGVDFLLGKLSGVRARAGLAAILGMVLAVELAPRPLLWARLPREEKLPAVYPWIARQPDIKALVELPIHSDTRENQYLYFSTLHWKPIANCYSGYEPASHRRLAEQIRFLPDARGFDLLRELWISHLVVHARTPARAAALRRWESRFAMGEDRQVERVYQSGEASVYRLLDAPDSSSTPKRAGLWKSGGEVRVGDQPLNSGAPSRGLSMR